MGGQESRWHLASSRDHRLACLRIPPSLGFGVLVVGAIKFLALRDWATKIHARMFQIDEEWVRRSYFMFFGYYKIAILVLNLVPYIALSIMM
jgi:hypothetical protein